MGPPEAVPAGMPTCLAERWPGSAVVRAHILPLLASVHQGALAHAIHMTTEERLALICQIVQPEQIKQCLEDYASINVWQLVGAGEAPGIKLTRQTQA